MRFELFKLIVCSARHFILFSVAQVVQLVQVGKQRFKHLRVDAGGNLAVLATRAGIVVAEVSHLLMIIQLELTGEVDRHARTLVLLTCMRDAWISDDAGLF